MFTKLLKYEFKSLGKWYISLYGAALVLATVIGFWFQTLMMRSPERGYSFSSEVETAEGFFFGIIIFAFALLIGGLIISTFLLIINRFRKNIYGRQGYLTMTLPVSSHQLILSKFTAAMIWLLLAILTAGLCALITVSIPALPYLSQAFKGFYYYAAYVDFGILVQSILALFLAMAEGILLIYFSISLGQLFRDHRTLMAVLFYFGISFMSGIIATFFQLNQFSATYVPFLPHPIMMVFSFILSIGYYFGTHYIMTKRLNLQ